MKKWFFIQAFLITILCNFSSTTFADDCGDGGGSGGSVAGVVGSVAAQTAVVAAQKTNVVDNSTSTSTENSNSIDPVSAEAERLLKGEDETAPYPNE